MQLMCSSSELMLHVHRLVLCIVGAGVGTALDVALTVGGQNVSLSEAFDFLPPQVSMPLSDSVTEFMML